MSKQEERLDYLLQKFKEDSSEYKDLEIGSSRGEKRKALRALMNIRMPKPMDQEIIKVQDEFLQEEAKDKGIVYLKDILTIDKVYGSKHPFADRLSIWQGDITRLSVDAIVNAANSQMLGCFIPCHQCIDNAIHSSAGIQLRMECHQIMNQKRREFGAQYEEPTGKALITKAYNLPAQHIIHTVGPIVYHELNEELCEDLRCCYQNILKCAVQNNIRSIAFCCISTGEFHFPNDKAAKIAVDTVSKFLEEYTDQIDHIIFNVFKETDKKLYEELIGI